MLVKLYSDIVFGKDYLSEKIGSWKVFCSLSSHFLSHFSSCFCLLFFFLLQRGKSVNIRDLQLNSQTENYPELDHFF